ncbi:MAG TPA: response regulator [Pyrinomonadaceae bacterium]|nr:response regulator [Pyrinomonadaceae bacterium]
MSQSVLIIDDEEHVRQMMRLALETSGYEVGEAKDGSEGLNLYGNGSTWNAVVLDQRMPGMDGLETLQRLRAANPSARIIMATAYASIELAVDAMKLGATDFVRKPMTPEALRNAVAAAVAKKLEPPVSAEDLTGSKQEPPPPGTIKTITLNGFSVLDEGEEKSQVPNERRFVVVGPEGNRHEVLVVIDEEPLGYVERMTRRRLPPESSFWTEQARDLLGDYLWSEGKPPPDGKLTVKDLNPNKLAIAERWSES